MSPARFSATRSSGAVLVGLVLVRVLVALTVGFGPWTDEAGELAGWDAERFHRIITEAAQPWAGTPVEYPPGSVVVFEFLGSVGSALTSGSALTVVGLNRALALTGLVADLAAALLLGRVLGRRSATAYLWLGLPLIPLGYLRLDQLTATIAVAAIITLVNPRTDRARSGGRGTQGVMSGLAAGLTVVGASIKLWPGLVLVVAAGLGRWRTLVLTAGLGLIAATVWLGWAGVGLSPVDQVLSLRGATGWHVESLPGALVALFGDEAARLELNAFRIGTLAPTMVLIGRVVAVAVFAVATALVRRYRRSDGFGSGWGPAGAAMTACVGALVVTAPLLSPQFLVWLVPWPVLAAADQGFSSQGRHLVILSGVATSITGFTLTVFGPPNLDGLAPSALLSIRNLVLILVVVEAIRLLARRPPSPAAQTPAG